MGEPIYRLCAVNLLDRIWPNNNVYSDFGIEIERQILLFNWILPE